MMTRNGSTVLYGLLAVRTVEALASSAMLPFVVLWAHREAGLGGVAAGGLFVGQAIGEFSGGVAGGGLADRFGRRRILLISTVGMALGYGLLALAHLPVLAILLFLAAGVFESAFHPTIAALVGDAMPDDRLPHAFSLLRIGSNAGRIAGPMLGALAALAGLSLVFVVSGALLGLAVLIESAVLPRAQPDEPDEDEEPELPSGTLTALRSDRALALLVLAGGLLAITFTWFEADGFVLLRRQTALSTGAYAALFTIAAGAIVLGQLPVTRMLRNTATGTALVGGAVLQAVGLAVLMAAGHGYAVLIVAVLLMAVGEMMYAPTISTVVTRRARPDQRASYQAALSITEDIGTAIGPLSGLALARIVASAGLWAVGAGVCAVAGVISRAAIGRRTEPPAELSRGALVG